MCSHHLVHGLIISWLGCVFVEREGGRGKEMIAKPGSVIKEEEGKSRRKIEKEEKVERKQEGICQKESSDNFTL